MRTAKLISVVGTYSLVDLVRGRVLICDRKPMGNSRGRSQFPQYLHRGRYDEIRKTWLNHGIPTFVARKLEVASDYGGWTSL